MCPPTTIKYILCGCIYTDPPVACKKGDSCPARNKMKIKKVDELCRYCFLDSGDRARWLKRVREGGLDSGDGDMNLDFDLDLDVDLNFEEDYDEDEMEVEEEEEEEEEEQVHYQARERQTNKNPDYMEDDEDEPGRGYESDRMEPDYGVDVSRVCYPISWTYLRNRKKERVVAELTRLMKLYGDTYVDGEFDI